MTRSFYDGNGRLSKVVRPNQYSAQADDGAGYQYTYDYRGQVLTMIGPDGQVLQTNTYDADGRLLPLVVGDLHQVPSLVIGEQGAIMDAAGLFPVGFGDERLHRRSGGIWL